MFLTLIWATSPVRANPTLVDSQRAHLTTAIYDRLDETIRRGQYEAAVLDQADAFPEGDLLPFTLPVVAYSTDILHERAPEGPEPIASTFWRRAFGHWNDGQDTL